MWLYLYALQRMLAIWGGINKKNIMKNKIFSEISTEMIPVYGAVILAVLYLFIQFILLVI